MSFLLRAAALWFAVSLPFVVMYVVFDPMKVLRWHDDMISDGFVPNKGALTAVQFEHNLKTVPYNSFILGSSLAINFLVDDWARYLPPDAVGYHFDSSGMDLDQLEKSLEFISCRARLDNVLIVWDIEDWSWDIDEHMAESVHFPFLTAPQLLDNPVSKLCNHWCFFSEWYSRGYLNGWICHRFINHRPKGLTTYPKYEFDYDPIKNEETSPAKDDSLKMLSDSFLLAHPGLDRLPYPGLHCAGLISSDARECLRRIAGLLDASGADWRFVLVPTRKNLLPAPADDEFLRRTFGDRYVLTQPALAYLTVNPWNYFDHYHFRPEMARTVMEYVYDRKKTTADEPDNFDNNPGI